LIECAIFGGKLVGLDHGRPNILTRGPNSRLLEGRIQWDLRNLCKIGC